MSGFQHRMIRRCALLGGAVILLSACSGDGGQGDATSGLSPMATLGKSLFADRTLSVSGQQACITCHVPSRAYAAASADGSADGAALAVPLGGPSMTLTGLRNAPSLMYAAYTPAFFFDADGAPNGGFFRDGRAASLADQAMQPLVTPFEMGGTGHDTADDVAARLRNSPNYPAFQAVFGSASLNDAQTVWMQIGQAIAQYEKEDEDFHPFSSKFDAWQRGKAQLTAMELKGFALFNNPVKGNCAACHVSTSADGGVTPALFTDFSYDNLGVPRNAAIPANSDTAPPADTPQNSTDGVHRYYDLGICGPLRDNGARDLSGICGQFKVPTLRNVALTAPYFHNGEFDTLVKAVTFYVQRDTHPETWYPAGVGGTVTKFDDLPAEYGGQFSVTPGVPGSDAGYAGNVNTTEVPYERHIGMAAHLDADEINDVVAFLCTLTDGYDPAHPAGYDWPTQCQAVEAQPAASVATTP